MVVDIDGKLCSKKEVAVCTHRKHIIPFLTITFVKIQKNTTPAIGSLCRKIYYMFGDCFFLVNKELPDIPGHK